MCHRAFAAATTVCALLLLLAPAAAGDIVDLTNGVRLPKNQDIQTEWGDVPTDEDLVASGKGNLTVLAYDAFEIRGVRGDAAQLNDVYVTATLESAEFAAGEQNGVRGYWEEAARAFSAAAENLDGAGRQLALYKCMLAMANTGNAQNTLRVADFVLASNPKTYYFGPAQETRARIFAQQGKLPQALAALKQVMDAPGMNVRDYFNAAYFSIWLEKFVGATTPEAFAEAAAAFRKLLAEIDGHSRKQLAEVPRLKTMMSLAASLRSAGQVDEARTLFAELLAATTRKTPKGILAGLYYGLGDLAFEEASAFQTAGPLTTARKEQLITMLDTAALHYLRVLLLYTDYAGQREMFGATRGAAKVFENLFHLSNHEDCEQGRRAYNYYVQAVRMQERGEARRLLYNDGRALKKILDEKCGTGAEEDAAGAESGEGEGGEGEN